MTESFLSPAVYNYTNRETDCRLISLSQIELRRQRLTGHEEDPVCKNLKEDNLHVVLTVQILRGVAGGLIEIPGFLEKKKEMSVFNSKHFY